MLETSRSIPGAIRVALRSGLAMAWLAVALVPGDLRGESISSLGGASPIAVSWNESGRLWAWDASGRLLPGWPVVASGAWPVGTPRLQDLDGDGQPEVVCLVKQWNSGLQVRAWRLDGQPCTPTSGVTAPVDMADTPELGPVLTAGQADWVWPTAGGSVAASAPMVPGVMRPGFPVPVMSGRPRLRLADLDGDGVVEVMGGGADGAAGRWFVLSGTGGPPRVHLQAEASELTDAPLFVPVTAGAAAELLLCSGSSVECRSADPSAGYPVLPGWPRAILTGPGDAARVADASAWVIARGHGGARAAIAASGTLSRTWTGSARLGASVDCADFPGPGIAGRWVSRLPGNSLAFEWYAGVDSSGRPRLTTLVLGNRHHGSGAVTTVGLLPPNHCRIWVNEAPAPAFPGVLRVPAGEVRVTGELENPGSGPALAMQLVLTRDGSPVARTALGHAMELRQYLDAGRYSVCAVTATDTLGRADVIVDSQLGLADVYSFPNPMHDRAEFLFRLSAAADVTVDVYSVAGRKLRSLGARLSEGSQHLDWDGRDGHGRPVANGVYLYRVQARADGHQVAVLGKLMRVK